MYHTLSLDQACNNAEEGTILDVQVIELFSC